MFKHQSKFSPARLPGMLDTHQDTDRHDAEKQVNQVRMMVVSYDNRLSGFRLRLRNLV